MSSLIQRYSTQVVRETCEAMQNIWQLKKESVNGWRKPGDFHVTVLYIGKDEEKAQKPIC
jgi:hypothetical protein